MSVYILGRRGVWGGGGLGIRFCIYECSILECGTALVFFVWLVFFCNGELAPAIVFPVLEQIVGGGGTSAFVGDGKEEPWLSFLGHVRDNQVACVYRYV